MEQKYKSLIATACADLIGEDVDVELVRPDENFGDFTTNIALKVANQKAQNPRELAQKIAAVLTDKLEDVEKVEIAGPGFINITLKDRVLFSEAKNAHNNTSKSLAGKVIVAEYSDPNAFKVLHGGHLYTSLVGDAISNLLEIAGGDVHRVNFGGDVGLHVAKTMWAIIRDLGGEYPEKLHDIADDKKLDWVSERYVAGNSAYEDNQEAKIEIVDINKRVYQIHTENDQSSPFAQIYWKCHKWSYDGFKALYGQLGMKPFEKYYPESSVFDIGLKTVQAHVGDVYEKSDGAIVFRAEKYGLFTQVFINSEGLPTYAGKDVGLIQAKYEDYKFDVSYMITDVAQKDHLAVVLKSIEQFEPELATRTVHHTHGQIKLQGGEKMSSRKGNILRADDILDAAHAAAKQMGRSDEKVILGAVRYSFLKNRIGGDIIYDPKESVSLEGNSGPYIQYALVRARSILRKAGGAKSDQTVDKLEPLERSLARKISMYPEAVEASLESYSPHHICNYLYELAQVFNRFYEKSRVIDDPRSGIRITLVEAYEKVLANGLGVLGMPTPEKM